VAPLATACVAGKTVSTVVKPTAATNGDASGDLNGALQPPPGLKWH
jgi:hypothetical protein